LLIAAGYACGIPELGYGATILAFGTAYIRALGGALGFEQDFVGPMAKQHRMFVLTLAAIVAFFWQSSSAFFWSYSASGYFTFSSSDVIDLALWIIVLGSALTCAIRLHRIAAMMKAGDTGK